MEGIKKISQWQFNYVCNDILLNMEVQKETSLVILDLSAALDTVPNETLLSRLRWRIGVDWQSA